VPEPTATAYQRFPGRDDLTDTTVLVDGGADGAIVSTTADLNTFLRALMDGRLLGPAELAEMRRTVPAPDFSGRPGTRYGLGIAWRPAPGCPGGLWFHGGTSFGTVSETGVTADGSASAAAAVFTLDFADEAAQRARAEATTDLVEHAVCGTS
jgi:D-alanyl-D-alanine carboxypeptidase